MMWIDGVSALNELHTYVAAILAFIFFARFGLHQQDKFHTIRKDAVRMIKIDWRRIIVMGFILIGAILSNVLYDMPAHGV